MEEDVKLSGPDSWQSAAVEKWKVAVQEKFSKEELVRELRRLIESRRLAPKTLYTLDAVARQGSHVGLPVYRGG